MSKRWKHPVRDKLEEVFCIGKSGFVRPAFTYNEGDKERGIPRSIETEKYNLNGKRLIEEYIGNQVVVNIRPNYKIKAFSLDIDIGSKYRYDYQGILACLEDIGITRSIAVVSSTNNGLHLWFGLTDAVNSRFLHVAIKAWLIDCGFEVADGTLEIWPDKNPTTYRRNDYGKVEIDHLARCFRLPCQEGGYVIDEDEGFEHDSIERFWLHDFDWCANGQDTETFSSYIRKIEDEFDHYVWQDDLLVPKEETKLESQNYASSEQKFEDIQTKKPSKKTKRTGRPSKIDSEKLSLREHILQLEASPRNFIRRLRDIVKEGWTKTSYSNFIVGAVAILASYDHRDYDVAELAKIIRWEAMRLPGYEEFASPESKKELQSVSQRSWSYRWAKSVIKYRSKINKLKK